MFTNRAKRVTVFSLTAHQIVTRKTSLGYFAIQGFFRCPVSNSIQIVKGLRTSTTLSRFDWNGYSWVRYDFNSQNPSHALFEFRLNTRSCFGLVTLLDQCHHQLFPKIPGELEVGILLLIALVVQCSAIVSDCI